MLPDKDEFERSWPLYQALTEQVRHFNTLQSQYRTMASTWLLAAIAGVGFIYSKDRLLPVFTDAAAGVIALAGGVGIILLWVLDVLVYHELLIANDEAQRELEDAHKWMPQVWEIRTELRGSRSVRENISMFYIGSILLLSSIAAFAFGHLLWDKYDNAYAGVAVFFALMIISGGAGGAMHAAANRRLGKKMERRARRNART